MKSKILVAAVLATVMSVGVFAQEAKKKAPEVTKITIGSKAPLLDVKTSVKGTPVKSIAKGIHVVEFWATWCGPCIESIPHITEMAKKHKNVSFTGVSIWEDNDDKRVEKFVKDMGAKMDYHVGYSGNKKGMSVSWMGAAAQNGIPTAFVIKEGVIQWIGHPMDMEKSLSSIVSGKWDVIAEKVKFDKSVKAQEVQMALYGKIEKTVASIDSGDLAMAGKYVEDLKAGGPEFQTFVIALRIAISAAKDTNNAEVLIDSFSNDLKNASGIMNYGTNFSGKNAGTVGVKAVEVAIGMISGKEAANILELVNAFAFYSNKEGPTKAAYDPKRAKDIYEMIMENVANSQFKGNKDFQNYLDEILKKLG